MISNRFKYDGKPTINLNELQTRIKEQIEDKINKGLYSFNEVPCCICNGKNFEILSEKDCYGLYMPVVICKDCGLIQINPRMRQKAYNQFYKTEYNKLYRGKDIPTNEFFNSRYKRGKRIYNFLKNNLKINLSDLRVFEVGTASGGILNYFKEKGNEVYGCDLDPKYIEFGRDKYNLRLEIGTIKNVDLPWTPDIVIYSHVLEHILDPIEEMIKLRSMINENTIIYIEVPGLRYMKDYYQGNFLYWIVIAHVYYFTLTTLRNLMNKTGYGFLYGDEIIYSIFKPFSNKKRNYVIDYKNDYYNAISFLKRMESYRIKYLTRSKIVSLLKHARLYNMIKKSLLKFN